jgi:HD-like signal output (HDOD) protein
VEPIGPKPLHLAPQSQPSEDAFLARDRLLQSISEDTDLPALGSSVSRVVQLASSDDEAVRDLAYFVLSDVALTQKILRIANTVVYRTYSSAPITTVSKAIFMLGFDVVKTSALAMLLVDGMSGKRAAGVRAELAHALTASVIGREMARRSHFKDAEEAAVAALFKNMGRLLVAAHDHHLYDQIAALIEGGSHTPTQASSQVLGCSFDLLGESVLQEWQIPSTIIKALNPIPQGILRPAKSRGEWVQQVVAFSTAAASLLPQMQAQGKGHEAASRALLTRFGAALDLDADALAKLFEMVERETRVLTDQVNLTRPSDDLGLGHVDDENLDDDELTGELGLPSEFLMSTPEERESSHSIARHPSGKPINAREQLMTGVQDITEMMASGRCKVNDLMMLVLETIYRGMGFRFATICLRDAKTNQYRARISLGDTDNIWQNGFAFPGASARDVFHLAMEKDADVMISDAHAAKIRDLIPTWHRNLLPDTCSFIILPLVVQKNQFGFFYADRALPAPEGVPSDETAMIRTLKGQVLAALNPR